MSFQDELTAAYDDGILPAVKDDCQLDIIRVDRQHSNEPIDDRIINGLRTAEVTVVDCTLGSNGAYFEAGYARALNRVLVFTCRADWFKAPGVHFDTKMFPYIVWTSPGDLRGKLALRLMNTVPSILARRRG
ncbi:MAG: hypothetical protein AB7N65_04755 [Vicinamibacterales bacterium]